MRALTSSVLAFEIIVVILFIPAAIQESSMSLSNLIFISLGLILLSIMAMGTIKKKYGILIGYLVQIFLILLGFLVNWMFILGLIFLGLWIMALKISRRTDELKKKPQE